MESLPDELFIQISSYLEPLEVINFSLVSKRFVFLTRDDNSWRLRCYEDSKAAARRRRKLLLCQQPASIAFLAQAVSEVTTVSLRTLVTNSDAPNAELQAYKLASEEKARALANWDPSYPGEKVNFYQEYIHRHAPITLSWFEQMSGAENETSEVREATGAGILYDDEGRASRMYAPLEDGSIGVWNACPNDANPESASGRLLAFTARDILLPQGSAPSIERDTGVVECVSIDRQQRHGYFAVANTLVDVDLNTLKPVSRHSFTSAITALSEIKPTVPMTVGTTHNLHLFDPRLPQSAPSDSSGHVDPIGTPPLASSISQLINAPTPRHALLSQPGPLSILHLPSDRAWDGNGDMWVAGRFTHLLNYDRRFFPRLRGTVHSGARLSSLTSLPYPYIPRERDYMRSEALSLAQVYEAKRIPGTTLIAAGEYKGKGSLELYGLSSEPTHTTLSSDSFSGPGRGNFTMTGSGNRGNCAQNRQTASGSKLLSVTTHGLHLAYSDGDANVKWVERDGFTPVREFSIDPVAHLRSEGWMDQGHEDMLRHEPAIHSLFAQPSSGTGDIVQKLIPTLHYPTLADTKYSPRLHEDNLIVWTGDGRLGMLGFGRHSGWDASQWEEKAERAEEEVARMQQERAHGTMMREALQWQANEARFMSGLGLPFAQGR